MMTESELLKIQKRADAAHAFDMRGEPAGALLEYFSCDIPALVESHREALRRIEELERLLNLVVKEGMTREEISILWCDIKAAAKGATP